MPNISAAETVTVYVLCQLTVALHAGRAQEFKTEIQLVWKFFPGARLIAPRGLFNKTPCGAFCKSGGPLTHIPSNGECVIGWAGITVLSWRHSKTFIWA